MRNLKWAMAMGAVVVLWMGAVSWQHAAPKHQPFNFGRPATGERQTSARICFSQEESRQKQMPGSAPSKAIDRPVIPRERSDRGISPSCLRSPNQ